MFRVMPSRIERRKRPAATSYSRLQDLSVALVAVNRFFVAKAQTTKHHIGISNSEKELVHRAVPLFIRIYEHEPTRLSPALVDYDYESRWLPV
jgi:hypothetical protein